MPQTLQAETRPAADVISQTPVAQAANGICYTTAGETGVAPADLNRIVATVPRAVAAALNRVAYYFVPLTVNQGDETLIADRYDVALSDQAVCHRNLKTGADQVVFISTRLAEDKFTLAFEFFINIGHAFVERAGVSAIFADLVWKQVEEKVRGETSLDAWELRKAATTPGPDAEKHRGDYTAAAFADSIAIYLLTMQLDVEYHDLRERDYTLLAPKPLADRLRKVAELFPPEPGFEFSIQHRRKS